MKRRGFLAGILAAATAPALVKAGSLMTINTKIVAPPEWTWEVKPFLIHPPHASNIMVYSKELDDEIAKTMMVEQELLRGELGHIEGFRFIQDSYRAVQQPRGFQWRK